MIFGRLKATGADWTYHFPKLGMITFAPAQDRAEQRASTYSVAERAVAELRHNSIVPTFNACVLAWTTSMPVRGRRPWICRRLRLCARTATYMAALHGLASGVSLAQLFSTADTPRRTTVRGNLRGRSIAGLRRIAQFRGSSSIRQVLRRLAAGATQACAPPG